MIPRRVPAVQTPVSGAVLAGAALAAIGGPGGAALEGTLARQFGARHVALLDSGTSALVLALRLVAREGDAVAMPAYGCPDLAAAAQRAGVRVRLYDVEPATLSPDLASLEGVLRRGVTSVVLVHFFGYPADATAVMSLARRHGACVIEDAAQGSGGTLGDVPLGSFGDLVVLSFGRGKGIGGGGGGALMARERALGDALASRALERGGAGWRALAVACAAAAVGRPSLFAIPSAIPGLRLGEMVDREAEEPRAIARSSRALAAYGVAREGEETSLRRAMAARLREELAGIAQLAEVAPIPTARPGYLRLAVLDDARRGASPALGIVCPYPIALAEHAWMRALVVDGETASMLGALELRDRLLALPTHRHVGADDVARIARHLARGGRSSPTRATARVKQLSAS